MLGAIYENNVTKIEKMITGDGIDVNVKFQYYVSIIHSEKKLIYINALLGCM